MGYGKDLDLTEILSAYREYLGVGTAGVNFVDERRRDDPDPFAHAPIPKSLYAPRSTLGADPWKFGSGPATCSTCTDLAFTKPTYAWDVNGWYRTIGATWPYVHYTASMLSRAYIAARGQESARATYYLTRLLDKSTRPAYDATALGDTYLDDRYAQDAMKAMAQAEASRRSAEGKFTDAVAVLDEWGYLLEDDQLDPGSLPVQDEGSPDETDSYEPFEWVYAYWLWKSYGGTTARLERWQTLLVSALSVCGARLNLAVGFMGRQPQDFVVGRFDEHWIVFLDDKTEPTSEMAAKAANALINEIQK